MCSVNCSVNSSPNSSGVLLCDQSFSGMYLCVLVCQHMLAHRHTHGPLSAVRDCTLTMFLHLLETACCSKSQLIGGWPVTLATQTERKERFKN